jgi:hypothetical protein
MADKLTITDGTFWDLWIQKIFRNLASMKFQMLLLLYIPVVIGMFSGTWINGVWVSKISTTVGLGFLGGGYITLALGRIYAKTKLTENGNGELDTDK